MTLSRTTFDNFVIGDSPVQKRLFRSFRGERAHFDIIVVGSGMGGGILADDLAERMPAERRILVVEAGAYLFPTHVYNVCRFPNYQVAARFASRSFADQGPEDGAFYIHERPQMGFGGRSVFWSGLIPRIQPWELHFFPERVRAELDARWLAEAGRKLNGSRSMGEDAKTIVALLRASALSADFEIVETPRAFHQPYLAEDGTPTRSYAGVATGVFNTAELLINQIGGAGPGEGSGKRNLELMLNSYVEDIRKGPGEGYELVARDLTSDEGRGITLTAGTVILAGGSIESAKLMQRSTLGRGLSLGVQSLLGQGLTDHPTTSAIAREVTHLGDFEIGPDAHAKIIFYSKGRAGPNGETLYPFNVEMNVNHEYWHFRESDADDAAGVGDGKTRIDIKFSFANCLDDGNAILPAPPFGYVPEIRFRNQRHLNHLRDSRFPALAGWQMRDDEIIDRLNGVAGRIFGQFTHSGAAVWDAPSPGQWRDGDLIGLGTVHHAVGTMRMPARASRDAPFSETSVVDEDLGVIGAPNLYVCDMSVMPLSSAANPVLTLAGLALRLSEHLAQK